MLQAARTANTVEWQNYENYVAEAMTTIPYPNAQVVVAATALMHRLTGGQRYADRAVAVMLNDSDNAAYFVTDIATGPLTVTLTQTEVATQAGHWILY